MTAQWVLIAAILLLGGVIATVGDRLGMRIGKARLSLFKLRPRQTATLITILTGSIISTLTFALLFALSEQLRRGVFDYEEIQKNLSAARRELRHISQEKQQTEDERDRAIAQQEAARRRLNQTNRSLQNSVARQQRTAIQLNRSQTQLSQRQVQLGRAQTNFQRTQVLLGTVSQQAEKLRSEIQQLQTERQLLLEQQEQVRSQIAERDQEIASRDRAIEDRNRAIAEREASLQDLESQRTLLEGELQELRQGSVALLRNQSLASGVVRIVSPADAPHAVDQLLRQANQRALQRIRPGVDNLDQQVIQITTAEVEQLANQIQNGQDYVVRILSKGNYVIGEPCVLAREACVQVYANAALNQVVFSEKETMTVAMVDPTAMSNEILIDRINRLVAAAQFRARQAGISGDTIQVADGRTETIVAFFNQLKQYNQPVEIRAIAANLTYTAGPLTIELQAIQNDQVLFSTE
jgi:uncharacterized protein (DUF3084 family)